MAAISKSVIGAFQFCTDRNNINISKYNAHVVILTPATRWSFMTNFNFNSIFWLNLHILFLYKRYMEQKMVLLAALLLFISLFLMLITPVS